MGGGWRQLIVNFFQSSRHDPHGAVGSDSLGFGRPRWFESSARQRFFSGPARKPSWKLGSGKGPVLGFVIIGGRGLLFFLTRSFLPACGSFSVDWLG